MGVFFRNLATRPVTFIRPMHICIIRRVLDWKQDTRERKISVQFICENEWIPVHIPGRGQRTGRQRDARTIRNHKVKQQAQVKTRKSNWNYKSKGTRKDTWAQLGNVYNNDEALHRNKDTGGRKETNYSGTKQEAGGNVRTQWGERPMTRLKSQPNPHVGVNKEAHWRRSK